MKLTYTNVNGYLIPNLTYKSGEQMEQLGKYGFLRRDYLKNHRNSLYQVMLLQDSIGEHLLEVDKAAREREEVILKQLEKKEPVLTKTALISWKEQLVSQYAPASVNAMLAVVNGYLRYMGWTELMVKPLKIQRTLFLEEEKELTKKEYVCLVHVAQKSENERLSLVIQTICATGIRVSELKFITVEAVQKGRAEISNKGKMRIVFLPVELRKLLKKYIQKQKKTAQAVFTTRNGKPLDRSNIWREMKKLCKNANVAEKKVFPHNLRHLFVRTFYSVEKDISRLADILGHTNLSTTRIYTAESGAVHARQMGRMGLVVT